MEGSSMTTGRQGNTKGSISREIVVHVEHVCGGDTIHIREQDLETFNGQTAEALYAASYGKTEADYHEWLHYHGIPRCSEINKNGKPCQNYIERSRSQLDLHEWPENHRKDTCKKHSHS